MGSYLQIQYYSQNPLFVRSSFFNKNYDFQTKTWSNSKQFQLKYGCQTDNVKRISKWIICGGLLFPVDTLAINVDSPVIASELSALSLLPYLGFLYFITKSKSTPKLTLFGFYFLLVFVAAAIPAGVYAKVHYVTSLANVDWLHGGAESLLMLTNLFIVLGLRDALRKYDEKE